MTLYRIQEGTFELPKELLDFSVNVFTLSAETASDFSLIISRDPHRPSESAADCAERLIMAALAEAPGATVVRRFQETLRVGRAYGIELVARLGNTPVVQRQLVIPLRPTSLILTASARRAFTEQQSAWFNRIAGSLEP